MSTLINNLKLQFKKTLLVGALLINIITNFLPRKFKSMFIVSMFLFEGYSKDPKKDLIELLLIKEELEKIINNRALAFGDGEHPKHYLINYHDFFINNIIDGESVLDVGCGYGAVARSIATQRPNSTVQGIDNNRTRLNQAIDSENPKNLTFTYGDATKNVQNKKWDIVVLSNVLEHIEHRVDFLKAIQTATNANKILVRVPGFERDWQIPLRQKLGINYFTDDDHKIEHTLNEFKQEVELANLEIIDISTQWGEIWSVCKPSDK